MRGGRIVVVAASLDTPGGQGIQARWLVDCLRAEGWPVELVPVDARFPQGMRWVHRCAYLRTAVNFLFYLRRLRAVRGAAAVYVFSAAHWSFLLGPAPALRAARRTGAQAVLAYHSGEAADHLRRWGRVLHDHLRGFDRIVVPSEFLAEAFARHGYCTTVIPNVVDTSQFAYRERRPLGAKLLSTRSLEPLYAVDNTLRAFALLRRNRPDAELTIAGDGSQAATLQRAAAAIGGVRFAGAVPPEGMPQLYAAADLFVNSSRVDNQPVSVLEAFSAGLPVVSTAAGGLAWMVRQDETGLVVPQDDPAAMAAAVSGLLADPVRARRLARRARREVERHTWPRVRKAWLSLLEEKAA